MASGIRGGKKLAAFLRRAKTAKSVKAVDCGFFSTAKYPSGIPVAAVAAWNTLGVPSVGIPERPFMQQAVANAGDELIPILVRHVDPRTMAVDRRTAGLAGSAMVGRIQRAITTIRTPPNKPTTIARKGSSNPLIDQSIMRAATTYRIDP